MDCRFTDLPERDHLVRKAAPVARIVGIVSFVTIVWASVASAQTNESLIDFDQALARMQRQIDDLQASAAHHSFEPAPTPPAPEKPKFPNSKLTGFFQADSVWFNQDTNNRNTVGDIQDGADFRRARLAATGQVWDNTSYILEVDFAAPGRPSFMDVWLELDNAVGSNKLRIGQFRHPFGMDGQTSVRELTFLERGLPFAFLPFRQIGAMLHGNTQDEMATWAISGFRYPTDQYGGNVGDNGGYGLATRITGLLYQNAASSALLHIGGGYCFIDPANNSFHYRNQPEVFVQETGGGVPAATLSNVPAFVDTGEFAANNTHLFNAELAAAVGSLYMQSEIFYTRSSRPSASAASFNGAYAYAGYFLTGESRPYNGKGGVFGRVKPKHSVGKNGGLGAWEIAVRWSYIDLNDADIRGGRLNDLTGGLNWYLNPYTKFQFNYIRPMLDNPTYGSSQADIFAARAQVDF